MEVGSNPTPAAMDKLNTVIVIPFYTYGDHDRTEITKACFSYYSSLGVPILYVGSEGKLSFDIAHEFFNEGDLYLEYEQNWVGVPPSGGSDGLTAKYEWSVKKAFDLFDTEYVTITGSDDFLSEDFLHVQPGFDAAFVMDTDVIIYDLPRKGLWVLTENTTYKEVGAELSTGAGITLSRDGYDKLERTPFSFGNDEVPGCARVGDPFEHSLCDFGHQAFPPTRISSTFNVG